MLTLWASLSGKSIENIVEESNGELTLDNIKTKNKSYSILKKGDKVNFSFTIFSFFTGWRTNDKIYLFEQNDSSTFKFSGEIIYKDSNFVIIDTHTLKFSSSYKRGDVGDFITGSGTLIINYYSDGNYNFGFKNYHSDNNYNFEIESILEIDDTISETPNNFEVDETVPGNFMSYELKLKQIDEKIDQTFFLETADIKKTQEFFIENIGQVTALHVNSYPETNTLVLTLKTPLKTSLPFIPYLEVDGLQLYADTHKVQAFLFREPFDIASVRTYTDPHKLQTSLSKGPFGIESILNSPETEQQQILVHTIGFVRQEENTYYLLFLDQPVKFGDADLFNQVLLDENGNIVSFL